MVVVETMNRQNSMTKPRHYWSTRRDIGITEDYWRQWIKQKHRTSNTRNRRNVNSTSTSSIQREYTGQHTEEYGPRSRMVQWELNEVWRLVEGIWLFLKSNRVVAADNKITTVLVWLRGGIAGIYVQKKINKLEDEEDTQDWEEFIKKVKTAFSNKIKAADTEWKIETF